MHLGGVTAVRGLDVASIKVLAGDWGKGSGQFMLNSFALPKPEGFLAFETVPMSEMQTMEIATEESVKRAGGTIGWGAVGAAALGPVGLLAGLLLGGRGKDVVFVARLKDGRKFLARTDSKTFAKIQAAAF